MTESGPQIAHRVYFVRHGESAGNKSRTHASAESPLTPQGRTEAAFVAERFKKLPIDLVITSNLKRAQETGKIIADIIGKPTKESELFQELVGPTQFFNLPYEAPEFEDIKRQWHAQYPTNEHWKHSDEESFAEVKMRAAQALRYLEQLPEVNVVVVTHGLFSKAFIAHLIFGPQLTWSIFHSFDQTLISKNTGITFFEQWQKSRGGRFSGPGDFRSDINHHGWYIRAWNDHAHLG